MMSDDATRLGDDGPDRACWHRQPSRNRPVRVAILTRGLFGSLLAALGAVVSLLAPPEGGRLATKPAPVRLVGDGTLVTSLSFSPDGRTLAAGHAGGALRLWQIETQRSRVVEINRSVISSVIFAPDGRSLALTDHGSTIHRYDPATLEPLPPLKSPGFHFTTVAFSHDGRTLAAGDLKGRVALWDVANRAIRAVLEGHRGMIGALAFSHDDRTLASGGGIDGTIRLWDTTSGRLATLVPGHTSTVNAATMSRVISLSFSSDDRLLVSGGGLDPHGRLWDARTGQALDTWRLARSGHSVCFVAFTAPRAIPNSLGSTARTTIRQWKTRVGATVLAGHSASSMRLAMTLDGRNLAIGDWSDVLVWKLERASARGQSSPGRR